jgi:DNA-directed RNA polymerase specialized sigma24 family protein
VPTGTIMSRLHRARRRIRDHLDRAGVAPRSQS